MTLDTTGGVIQTTKAILHDGTGQRFLLVKESDGTWGLPGGAKELEDVDMLSALRRELFEELSLQPEQYTVINSHIADEFQYPMNASTGRKGLAGFNNFFLVIVQNVDQIKKEEKLLELAWCGAEEAVLKLEHDSMRRGFGAAVKLLKKV